MTAENAYDVVPYPTRPYPQTHPDRLATVATLFGLSPAPAERCRVLEIGCGNGDNLIPMAFAMPGSTFVGVDLAASAVEAGNALVSRVGLDNISLRRADLRTFEPEREAFDYVIAHGIYAWVAPDVQDRLLATCRAALAPRGAAFVSYNALPGSHVRLMIREMLQYHLRGVHDPRLKHSEARGLLELLRRSCPEPTGVQFHVGKQAERTLTRDRDNLLHDELEEDYRPVYFHQFMDHASRHGLQYVGESDFIDMNDERCVPDGKKVTWSFAPDQIVEKEQYMDFLKCRSFRQTILCRREETVTRDAASQLHRFDVVTRARPVPPGGTPDPPGLLRYRTPDGVTLETTDVHAQRMMTRLLKAAPWQVPFRDLVADGTTEKELRPLILQLYATAILDLRLWVPPCVRVPSARPEASRLARVQLERGQVLANLAHLEVNLTDVPIRRLLRLLDGTRDRADLLRELTAEEIAATPDGLEETLQQLARLSLLTA